MTGLILINSYMVLPTQDEQTNRFVEEFKRKNIEVDVMKTSCFPALIDSKEVYRLKTKYDFVLYLDKDRYLIRILENLGFKVFNNSTALDLSDDKMMTHIELAKIGIKMPKTIPGLLCYYKNSKISKTTLNFIGQELGYPVIVKSCYGSLGKDVYICNNREELEKLSNKLINTSHLFQEFIKSSYGTDMRVYVVGGKAVAWMQRKSENDFRSNIGQNGQGIKVNLPEKFKICAEKIATFMNLDFCGIDLLFGENDEPILCEVNPKAFFSKLEEVSGVNVAEKIVDHIINVIKK